VNKTAATGLSLCALVFFVGASMAQDANADLIKKGARAYDNNCAQCHGDKLINSGGVAYDLRRLRDNERPRFDNSVMNGKNAMPAWHGIIKEADLDALWAYIRANANP
jgi:mono/diheme cytochrome c family protein